MNDNQDKFFTERQERKVSANKPRFVFYSPDTVVDTLLGFRYTHYPPYGDALQATLPDGFNRKEIGGELGRSIWDAIYYRACVENGLEENPSMADVAKVLKRV